LNNVIVAPNPYSPSTGGQDGIKFLNLTPKATIWIYTNTGERVKILEHIDKTGVATWDAKNDAGKTVANGIYVYYVTAFTDGKEELKAHGKFAIVK
jgi:flagellar hook assembly protein FlgD